MTIVIILIIVIIGIGGLLLREYMKVYISKKIEGERSELIKKYLRRKKEAEDYINEDRTLNSGTKLPTDEEAVRRFSKDIEFYNEFLNYDKKTIGYIFLKESRTKFKLLGLYNEYLAIKKAQINFDARRIPGYGATQEANPFLKKNDKPLTDSEKEKARKEFEEKYQIFSQDSEAILLGFKSKEKELKEKIETLLND